MTRFGGHPRTPGCGRLPRGLAVAAVAAVTVVPLAASSAVAAPAAPTAYAVFGKAEPLVWGSSSSIPTGNLHVPFVWGKTNNVAIAKSEAKIADPDEFLKPLSGDAIAGLTCPAGFDENSCRDPFKPLAQVEHAGPDARRAEMAASWPGKDGKLPGSIRAITECAGNCGPQVVRSVTSASGPAGALGNYVSVGSSSASHDLFIDDKGRLVSFARSQLDNVSIGPKNEVHFSSLVTTAHAVGAGPESSKDGRADIRIHDFFILDNPVELTRAGLRLANGGPSEQEAYDGAKVLLEKLKERGIFLELPNFDAQLTKSPAHVAVDTKGLRVTFQQAVGSLGALTYPLELGHATAVVGALDAPGRTMDVNDSNGVPTIENTPAAAPPPPGPPQVSAPDTGGKDNNKRPPTTKPGAGGAKDSSRQSEKPGVTKPPPVPPQSDELPVPPPPVVESPPPTGEAPPAMTNPEEGAFGVRDVTDKLGLRGARSVSRAFGAFLGLGLILPVARFLIRRLG